MPYIFILLTLFIAGCGTSVKDTHSIKYEPDIVLSRIDNLSTRPNWLNEAEPFKIENGFVISTGMTTLPADSRIESGYRIAQNNAKAAIAGTIESKLEFILQNAEEGTAIDTTQIRYIGSEVSSLTSNSIQIDKNYWEKVVTTQESGQKAIYYRVFSTVKMPEDQFKRAIFNAIKKTSSKTTISNKFAELVDSQWEGLFEPKSDNSN